MKKLIPAILTLVFTIQLQGQENDKQAIIHTIDMLFDGMRESDSTKLMNATHETATLKTTYTDRSGIPRIQESQIKDFIKGVLKPHDAIYDERIWSYEIEIDGLLATAWTKYTFFLGEKMSHCGVNAFQLFKSEAGWKIIGITDTRRKDACQTEPDNHEKAIHTLMDNWHKAAAEADEDTFFGSMTSDGIYLGTDASERWLRDDMKEWSKQYFERESAWAFTASKREIYFSEDGKTAWFEEMLDTWMGTCRGSGVLNLTWEGWKIKHYDLSIMVPNDVVKDYLKLLEKE